MMHLTIFLLLLSGFYYTYASDKADIDTLHQRAYKLLPTDPDSAFALGVLTEHLSADEGLELEEAKSLFIQAYIYRQKEELGKAFILYLKALEILRPLHGTEPMLIYTKVLLNAGAILDYHYAYPQAIQYYDEGIDIAKAYNFDHWLAVLYYNKAASLRHNKAFQQALSTLDLALDLTHKNGNEKWFLSSLNQQGLTLKDMGRYNEARESYQKIIDFEFGATAPEKHRGQAWHNMAVTYLEEEKYAEAETAYLQAAIENEKRPGSQMEYITWMDLGETYYLMGRYEKAFETAKKAEVLYDDMLLLPDHYALFDLLSKITYELSKYDLSRTYSEQFIAENNHFLEAQKEILQVKDQYKMEILTAGFFLEVEASENREQSQMTLVILVFSVIFVTVLFIYEKVKQYNVRRSIKKAILDIERESDI